MPIFRTLPGRLFLFLSLALLGFWGLKAFVALPDAVDVLRRIVALGWIGSIVWLGLVLMRQYSRPLLWSVRRKLILSYLLIGLVPVALVAAFVLAGSVLLYTDVAAYVFHEGFSDVSDEVQQAAVATATEVEATPGAAQAIVQRRYASLKAQSPGLSLAVMPATGAPLLAIAGPWADGPPPSKLPAWVTQARGYRGLVVVPSPESTSGASHLVIRSAVSTASGRLLVMVDLPVDAAVMDRIREKTGMSMGTVTLGVRRMGPSLDATPAAAAALDPPAAPPNGSQAPFRETVASLDFKDWQTEQPRLVSIKLDAPLSQLYARLAAAQSVQVASDPWKAFLVSAVIVGVLLSVAIGSFLYLGGRLARQITSAVHELSEGTDRVQRGNFAHPISITSPDQLGEMATKFNRMSVSIERSFHVEREKQRLDDELRIAREIQQSLLPVGSPDMPGISVAAICEPAREVGGDYYDFFVLGPRQLGLLIADVSGKGTSAALYMAELKGIMLALSHTERSPRRLLIEVNRLLANHLDNRSFITMTYAVVDLDAMTLTCARAGHTPLIVASEGRSEVIVPDGMVLGLRLPGASTRFETMLEEHTRSLRPGDVIVLYTDGVTEAMDINNELFGDATLAQLVATHQDLDAAGLRERVLREVRAFVGAAEPHDDMTMVVLALAKDAGGRS